MPPVVITGMMVGAAVGAVSAAITGGNILKGALFGAIGGGVMSAFSAAAGAATGAAEGAAGGAAEGALSTAASTALPEAASTAVTAAGESAVPSGIADSFSASTMGNPSAFTGGAAYDATAAGGIGSGGGGAAGMMGPPAPVDTSLTTVGSGNTGLSAPVKDTGLFSNPTDLRLSQGAQTAPMGSEPSFLDKLLEKGSSMMSNRFAVDAAGRIITGFAQGQAMQAQRDWQSQQIAAARANARFGNITTRYDQTGMMGPATYAPQK